MTSESVRHCTVCGAATPVGEPCLACALSQALLDAPDPPTERGDATPSSEGAGSESPSSPRPGGSVASGEAAFDPRSMPFAFGRYEVRREIAIGGMGAVYEAFDTRLGRLVALKLMRSLLLSTEEEKMRFRAEAEAVAKLDHPHIVPIYEVGEQGGQPYFTMKLIEGVPLATRLREGPLPPREAASVMAAVSRAVAHAHERKILHRDLKPGNIVLDDSGHPWLMDFGLAKQTASQDALTRTGAALGTPEFMSPEQADGRMREVTAASDVWALGAILFHVVTGQMPFRGESRAEVFRDLAEGRAGRWYEEQHGQRLELPKDLATLVERCMQIDPLRRLPGALYLAEELDRWLADRPIISRPISPLERAGRWLRHRRGPLAAVGLAVMGGAALIHGLLRTEPSPTGNDRGKWHEILDTVEGPAVGGDGLLYAVSTGGGEFGYGSIFRFPPERPEEMEIFAHFGGDQERPGAVPGVDASPIEGGDGRVYGFSRGGGEAGGGTLFRIESDGSVRTLHTFGDEALGFRPAKLQQHSDGWLWGTLSKGGVAGKGGLFRFHPETGRYDLRFSCSGSEDPMRLGRGCHALVEARSGVRYFAAGGGEVGARSAIYRMEGDGPAELVHAFPILDAPGDVGFVRGFAVALDGEVYLVTEKGGNHGVGTLQRIREPGISPEVVHHFRHTDGGRPYTEMRRLPDGRFCGVTSIGGAYGQGAIYAFTPPSETLPKGEMQVLASLHHSGGEAALTVAPTGVIYGAFKDQFGRATRFFRCDPSRPGVFEKIVELPTVLEPSPAGPPAGPERLVADSEQNGVFYGMCNRGGAHGHGALFRWREGERPEFLLDFTGDGGAVPGSIPFGQLAVGSDGALYGRTRAGGGRRRAGTIFRFDPASGEHTLIAMMEGLFISTCGLVERPDGKLYGTAPLGGATGCGAVFRVSPPQGGRRAFAEVVAEFTGVGGPLPGIRPGALFRGSEGALYGVTSDGNAFVVRDEGVRLLSHLPFSGDGPAPSCLLAQGDDGWLYGLPVNGNQFTLFRLRPDSGEAERVPASGGRGWGNSGWCGLVSDGKGGFLTVSQNWGEEAFGGVIRFQPDGSYEVPAIFTGRGGSLPGAYPRHELLPVGEAFYGSCPRGGANDRGVIFKLTEGDDVKVPVEF